MRVNKTDWAEAALTIIKGFWYVMAGAAFYDLVTKVNFLVERCR